MWHWGEFGSAWVGEWAGLRWDFGGGEGEFLGEGLSGIL